VTYLAMATLYSLTLPLKRTVTLVDTVVLVAIFVAYTVRIAKAPPEEPNLVGPSAWLATMAPGAAELVALSVTYLLLAALLLARARHLLGPLVGDGLRTPYQRLTDQPGQAPRPAGHRPPGPGRRQAPS
jgi:cation:H+ antiporter